MDTIILDSNLPKALAHGGRDEFDALDDGRDNVCDAGRQAIKAASEKCERKRTET